MQTLTSAFLITHSISQQPLRVGIRLIVRAAAVVFAAVAVAIAIAIAIGYAVLGSGSAFAQSFVVAPSTTVVAGAPVSIALKDLPPTSEVRIVAERAVRGWMPGAKRMMYRAEATYTSNERGELDLATATPKSGSYKGADVRGLFWSMMPTKTEAAADAAASEVTLAAFTGEKPLAKTTLTFLAKAADLVVEKPEKFPGAVYAYQPGTAKRPGLIVLGGSEGGNGNVNDLAQRLASRGFAVLSLPYYSPKQWPDMKQEVIGLPEAFADIEINRLSDARDYLRGRPQVDGNNIGAYGVSKGAEFALLGATQYPWLKAVVAMVPTDVVWEGWGPNIEAGKRASFAFNGKPFAFTPYKDFEKEFMGFQTGADVKIRRPQDNGRAENPAAAVAARIPIERYKGALMVVGGHDDQVWNSAMMAHNITERRAEAKLDTLALIYTDAGHYLSGDGWSPSTQYNAGPSKSGGTPEANARAQAEAWEKSISFLARNLGGK